MNKGEKLVGFLNDQFRLAVFDEPWNEAWWPSRKSIQRIRNYADRASIQAREYYSGYWPPYNEKPC